MAHLQSNEFEVVAQNKNFRALIANPNGSVIGSHGSFVVRHSFPFNQPESLVHLPVNWRRSLGRSSNLAQRLLRLDLYRMVRTPAGTFIAATAEGVVRLSEGENHSPGVFNEFQGRRPISLTVDAQGRVYFGEYFSNKERTAVKIFMSEDDGRSWSECYQFADGSIRHVHGLVYDPWLDKIWTMTGDYGDEAILGLASPGFSEFEIVLQGNQQTRICDAICRPDAVYFCTDTPLEQNYAYQLKRGSKSPARLSKIQNSVLFMGQACGGMFASTIVEPSETNTSNKVHIWHSADGTTWKEIMQAPRDRWSLRFFGYPTASFATSNPDCPFGFINFRGARGLDGDCLVIKKR